MSIIYDALKKVEGNLIESSQVPVGTHARSKVPLKARPFLVYSFVVFLGFFSMKIIYSKITSPQQVKQAKKPLAAAPNILAAAEVPPVLLSKHIPVLKTQEITEDLPHLVLNGIFFSGGAGYALINNQILEEGDGISGLVVRRISERNVELQAKDSVVTLSLKSNR